MPIIEGGELTNDQIKEGIRTRTLGKRDYSSILWFRISKIKGFKPYLDAAIEYLPAPNEVKAIKGTMPDNEEVEVQGHLQMTSHFQH